MVANKQVQVFDRQTDRQTDRQIIFDILKFVLSLMVVAIHSQLFPLVLYPWLRMAVPLFFMISSYFFWSKLKKEVSDEARKIRLKKFVLRNCRLYFFWFIILLPYTLYIRHYFDDGVFKGFLIIFHSLLFSSTFPGSWFLQALIFGVVIIYYASRRVDERALLILSVLAYFIAVARSSYWFLIEDYEVVAQIFDYYNILFGEPMFNISASLVWIAFGKFFAEHKFEYRRLTIVLFAISAVFLYLEWTIVKNASGLFNNDCYFSLLPFCFFFFSLIKDVDIPTTRVSSFIGKASVIIYTTHIPLINTISFMLRRRKVEMPIEGSYVSVIVFVITVTLCIWGSYIVFQLEKFKHFKFLKYSH